MHEKDNYLKTAELSTEQNCNMIDGVPNNTPIPPRFTPSFRNIPHFEPCWPEVQKGGISWRSYKAMPF